MNRIFRLVSWEKRSSFSSDCFTCKYKSRFFSMDISPGTAVDLTGMRVAYDPKDADKDFSIKNPFKLFDVWFNFARNTSTVKEANAMAIATADKSGKPSVRYVLLKNYGKEGFTFFTNYDSRKGKEIVENPQVSLLFYWDDLCRQVRIEGKAVKVSEEKSDEYFYSRPQCSQVSAAVSKQSEVIQNKESLIKEREKFVQKYSDESLVIPRPNNWGGFLVVPDTFEFWCGRSDRFHDRIKFRKPSAGEKPDEKLMYSAEEGWIYEYLSP